MRNITKRLLKRFIVLVPGIAITIFSLHSVFPYFDRRLPVGLAVFVTYVIGAYLLVPAAIRIYRIIRPADHLPHYCITPDGFASDPLNIGLIGTKEAVVAAMEQAGWYVADSPSIRNVSRNILSTLLGWSYLTAPVSNLYLFGRRQDIAFEIPIGGGVGKRHHVRFWATTYQQSKRITAHTINWHHRRAHLQGDKLLWVGAASKDSGLAPIRHNLQLTHMIDPDTDQERRLIVQQLEEARLISSIQTVKLGKPYRLVNRALLGYLQADGKMSVIILKKSRPKRP